MQYDVTPTLDIPFDSADFFQQLWNGSPYAIIIIDIDGLITHVNDQIQKLFDFSPEEIIGCPIEKLIPARFCKHQDIRSGYMNCPHKRDSLRVSGLKGLHKSGHEIDVDIALNPMITAEKTFAIAFIRDLSPLVEIQDRNKLLQEELFQAQKISALGELSSGIAHDFGNVVHAILSYAKMAKNHNNNNDTKMERYLNQINKVGNHAYDLTKNLMKFIRNDSTSKKEIVLEPLVNDIISMLRATLTSSIKIELMIDKPLPKVLFDTIQLQQMLINICINARDAMSGTGQLNIELGLYDFENTCCDSCGKSFSGNYVVLNIKDNGTGIASEAIGQMFDPFFTTKIAGKGTGIGLSVVNNIVHQNGGHILINSVQGEGTSFRVLLSPHSSDTE